MKDFKFELKKFILNKKNRYILVLISAIIVGYSTYATISFTSLFSNNTASLLQDVQDNEKSVQDNIKNNEDILKDAKTSAARDQLNDTLNYYKEQNIIYEKQVTALNANHINEYFRLQKKVDQLLLNAENGQDKALKQEIKYITTVQERHLNFEVMASMQTHAFGNFHQQFIPILSSSLFIVLFSSMISILVASGYESKENRFYRFAGIDLRKNLLIKVLSGTLATFAWILLSSIVYFLIIGVVNGFGAWNYPAYLGNVDFMRFTLTNITIANGILDLGSVFYLFFVILFLASLGALISVFVKRSMVVVGVIALFVMGYSMIGKVSWIISIKRFIPFSYFEPLKLFGNPTDLFGRYSLVVGASYLFVLSALFLSISIFVLKNQKIRSV